MIHLVSAAILLSLTPSYLCDLANSTALERAELVLDKSYSKLTHSLALDLPYKIETVELNEAYNPHGCRIVPPSNKEKLETSILEHELLINYYDAPLLELSDKSVASQEVVKNAQLIPVETEEVVPKSLELKKEQEPACQWMFREYKVRGTDSAWILEAHKVEDTTNNDSMLVMLVNMTPNGRGEREMYTLAECFSGDSNIPIRCQFRKGEKSEDVSEEDFMSQKKQDNILLFIFVWICILIIVEGQFGAEIFD